MLKLRNFFLLFRSFSNTKFVRKITIILDLEVLSEPVAQIGNPISFENGQPFTDGPQQPAGQPQYQAPPQQQQQQQYNHQHPQHQPNFGNQQSYGQNYEVVNNNYMQHVGGHNEEDISQHPVCPIKSLSPYRQKWVIKARVTFKSTIRTWQNAKGAGKVANVNLLDEQGGEISATMWKDAVDKFYDFLQVDKVYYISRASIKQANKKFATLNSAYDLTLEINSIIQAAKDDSSIKKVIYNCVPLSDIATLPEQTLVDVCAIILNVGDLADIQTKRGVNTYKRNLTLGDKSNASIELTIWGDDAANFQEDGAVGSVLAGKSLRISDFNGKSLSTGMVTQLDRNPDIPEAHALRGWYDSLNPDQARFDPLSVRRMNDGGGQDYQLKSFAQMKDEYINAGDEPKYFSVKGTVTMYRKENNVFYPACQDCNRKLLMVGSSWSCEKCQINDAQPQYRYILSCTASDHTGSQWLSAFNDVGVQLIGYTADQLAEWKGSENDAAYDAAFDDANFKSYKFRYPSSRNLTFLNDGFYF